MLMVYGIACRFREQIDNSTNRGVYFLYRYIMLSKYCIRV